MLTNSLNLPQPFVDAATSSHRYKPNRYSVTEVLCGTCEAVLKRRYQGEQDEDVADRVWAIFGTAVHKVLQEAKATDSQLQENWLAVPIKGTNYELSGIFDLYDDETKTVTDWKTCSVWKVTFGDFEDWRKQTLMYCWMLRQLEIDASRGEIVAIMRDHNQRKAKTEKDYPKHPVYKIGWDFSDKDFSEVETDIRRWFAEVADQEARESDELTSCSPERRWHKPDKWAVMKDGRKRAVRVFEDEEEAVELLNRLKETDKGHHIEFREGEDTRCQSYCSVAQFCPYGRNLLES
jgi:hypothetical protein